MRNRITEINQSLPKGVEIVPLYDQGILVKRSIRTIASALLMGLLCVCVVSFIFLGRMRNIAVVVLSLPFAMLFSWVVV